MSKTVVHYEKGRQKSGAIEEWPTVDIDGSIALKCTK
jgi:hypothetical protein